MKKIAIVLLVSLTIGIITGCTSTIGNFTIASTRNMDIKSNNFRIDSSTIVKGDDTQYMYIIIPTGIPEIKEAMNNAIQKAPGSIGLSDVTIKYGGWYIPLIYGQLYYIVEGSPIYEMNK